MPKRKPLLALPVARRVWRRALWFLRGLDRRVAVYGLLAGVEVGHALPPLRLVRGSGLAVGRQTEDVLGDEVERELLGDRGRARRACVEEEVDHPLPLIPRLGAERLHRMVCGVE